MMQPNFKFVDLFSGIGGFHAALSAFGGECVKAVEIDKAASEVYERNWKVASLFDITKLANEENVLIPKHDVLTAGFSCQPFSKSGAQRGMEETRGTLYWNILKIIEKRHPSIVLLENVRNLAGPRHAHEWEVIIETLRSEGYRVSSKPAVFSPHLLPPNLGGRPQVRERVFIAATYVGKNKLTQKDLIVEPPVTNNPVDNWNPSQWDLGRDLPLDHIIDGNTALSENEKYWINAWDEFVVSLLKERGGERLPGFPLWADSWKVSHDAKEADLPKWKQDFLDKNAAFYSRHKKFIDDWASRWELYSEKFPPSRRKLEWQAQDSKSLWETVMHFRPSGIRAKKPNYLPALVAITQTSIIGPEQRRISTREAARLQGLPDWFQFGDQTDALTYKQLGNGVNVGVVWFVLKKLVERDQEILKKTNPQLLQAISKSGKSPDEKLNKRKY